MPISQADLKAILQQLPEPQRDSAMKLVLRCDHAGWRKIGLWVWIKGRGHIHDIVGISPNGNFGFLTDTNIQKNLR